MFYIKIFYDDLFRILTTYIFNIHVKLFLYFIITEEKESRRQKRKTARNAEEIIRKKYLNSDSDSSDSTEDFVTVNHKLNKDVHSTSLPSLKRNCSESEVFNGNIKKTKMNIKDSEEKKDVTQLSFIEKFFRRDLKERLPKLTQEVKKRFILK